MEQQARHTAPPAGPAARLVAWKPDRGKEREFELGYKRHLEWHRTQGDAWTWHGWTMISGDRVGTFVDGTFFHEWTELDRPVAPQEDLADNLRNVFPYASVASSAAYELIRDASDLPADALTAPLMTFVSLTVAPGAGRQLEARAAKALAGGRQRALFRPVDGASDYLLLLPATRTSDLSAQAEALRSWAASVNGERPLVSAMRTETGRYRGEMSYLPGKAPAGVRSGAALVPAVPGLPQPPGYSYVALSAGQLVFLAGQVAVDERGAVVGKGDFAAQVRKSFANVKSVLAAVGCTPADVIKVNYYVIDLIPERLAAIRAMRDEFFAEPRPVSTLVGVTALFDPDVLFEVEVLAAKTNR